MKAVREFVINAVVGGVLVLLPVYLAVLLLLQGFEDGRECSASHSRDASGLGAG
jgi:hypothetical protein